MRRTRYEMTIIQYNCDAPEKFFGPIEDIPKDDLDAIGDQGGLPCDGGETPGEWCSDCRWTGGCVVEEIDEDYDYS